MQDVPKGTNEKFGLKQRRNSRRRDTAALSECSVEEANNILARWECELGGTDVVWKLNSAVN